MQFGDRKKKTGYMAAQLMVTVFGPTNTRSRYSSTRVLGEVGLVRWPHLLASNPFWQGSGSAAPTGVSSFIRSMVRTMRRAIEQFEFPKRVLCATPRHLQELSIAYCFFPSCC